MRLLLILLFIISSSCSSKKDILLIQDANLKQDYNFKFKDIKIKPDDILRINISSKSVNVASLYNSGLNPSQTGNILSYQIEGYLVNSEGYVNIPILDPIMVNGLTLSEASNKIQKQLEQEDVLKNSTVDIKILNAYFTVIGEVNSPGRYSFLENNMSIFQALGIAGDLTING
ncbi:MAG: ligand-binding protein, partial [Crocinitomicaceae bacterium]|nr:ligand-binding protein [Crocinitomicaceae bacterium]